MGQSVRADTIARLRRPTGPIRRRRLSHAIARKARDERSAIRALAQMKAKLLVDLRGCGRIESKKNLAFGGANGTVFHGVARMIAV